MGTDDGASYGTAPDFLTGGGEMGRRMRALDWAATPLGSPAAWAQSLRTSVSTCLNCAFPILVWWGRRLVMLYNDSYVPILGAKHPAALGAPGQGVWPEVWDVIGPMLARVMAEGQATRAEDLLLLLHRHGYAEECYFSFSYSPIRDETGGVGGVFCPVVETTGRVTGERRLRLLRQLAERTGDLHSPAEACAIAAACLAEGAPHDLPFAAFYLFAETDPDAARLAGTTCPGAVPPFLEAGSSPLANAAAQREPMLLDARVAGFADLPAGPWQQAPSLMLMLPLGGGGARPFGFMVAGLNPHRPAEEVRGFAALVAGQVATAIGTAQAYAAERRRAEALAEIDRAKTAFFSNISHEFRTPLTLLLGPLEGALAGDLPAPLREELELAHRNALRLQKLVNALLDFSRIEAGRAQARFAPTDLAAFTAELAAGFRSVCERAGLRLEVDCPPLPEPVFVDRMLWESVVLNLLSNAIKFTFAGHVAVRLRAADRTARLTVEDSGVGIPRGELDRIFDRFHRVEGQRSRTHEGSGIGLALVRELVGLHGGTILVESEEGRGSAFTVALPLGAAHLDPDRLVAEPPEAPAQEAAYVAEALGWVAPPAAPPAGGAGGARILLADDNADMRDYVARLLGRRWEVEAAADGEAALAAARARRPDLVLADVMMPRLDGFGLLRAIRADPALRDVPTILLSARAGEEARIDGLEAGADDYVAKPFAAPELLARVRANLALAQLRREALEAAEARLAERTAERDRVEEQLRQSQKMEALGQLTGGIAHDFNNLLTVVRGGLEMTRKRIAQGRAGEVERHLGAAEAGVDRAAALIHRLLAFARRQALAPRPVDPDALVGEMVELVRRTVGPAVALETRLEAGGWQVRCDPNQLEGALLNLAINARDAMPEGGRLRIATRGIRLSRADLAGQEEETRPGEYVRISVTDTGRGMDAAVRARAFEPFFTTKPIGQGTGLGLSQLYGFVRQSDGLVRLDSTPGRGTAVHILLPRHQGPAEAGSGTVAQRREDPARGTVLLVEDEPQLRTLAAEAVRELGCAVLEAPNGPAALQVLGAGAAVDLLVTDVGLPGGLNGRQLADAAREARPGLPVLFITGYAGAALAEWQLDRGMEILGKPYTLADLAARIAAMLAGGARGAA